jgi:ABC-type transport system involved in multi-copper enzyme maturation permease subunit
VNDSIVGKLIVKELALNRTFMLSGLLGGLAALAISMTGKIGSAVGGIMFLTALIAYGVILPMYAIGGERKEKTRLFVLSLPVSRGEYLWAKVVGVTLSFLGPWTVLLIAAMTLILTTRIPDGMVVFLALIMTFALADFCVIACASMLIVSEGLMAIVIVFMNMSVTFFMVGITNLTRIGADMSVDAVNWSTPALVVLGSEVAVMVMAFVVLFWIAGREPEVI